MKKDIYLIVPNERKDKVKKLMALFIALLLTLSIISINTTKAYAATVVNKTYQFTVKDDSGNLMPNTWILMYMPNSGYIDWKVTDSNGNAKFDNVPINDDSNSSNRQLNILYSQEFYSHQIRVEFPTTSVGTNDVVTENLTLMNSGKDVAVVTYKSTNTPAIPGITVQVQSKFDLGNIGVTVPQDFYDYVRNQYSHTGVTDATGQVTISLDTWNYFDVTYSKDAYTNTRAGESYGTMGLNIKYFTEGIYIPPKGSVTVKYQDENGTDIGTPDVISNLDMGTYTENAKTFSGYTLNDSSSKSVTLDSSNPDQTIIFSYNTNVATPPVTTPPAPTTGSVTVKYQDGSGTDIGTPDVFSNLAFGTYTENAKSFTGYTLNDSSSKSVTIDSGNPDQTIIFNYNTIVVAPPVVTPPTPPVVTPPAAPAAPKGSVTVKYQDENGTDIGTPTVSSNLDMGTYTENAMSFTGYTLNDSSSKSVTLDSSNPDQTIIFKYQTIKGSITINYVDKSGNKIADSDVLNNLSMGTYNETAKQIPDYEIDFWDNDWGKRTVTLSYDNPNATITFVYVKLRGTIVVYYKDFKDFGGEEKEIKPADTYSDLPLGTYSYWAPEIPGYTFYSSVYETREISTGVLYQEITFWYWKTAGSLTIKYQDENGKDIADPTTLKNLTIATYIEKAKNFNGYTLDGAPTQTVTLTVDKKDQGIIFKYKNNAPGITVLPQTGDNSTPDYTPVFLIASLGTLFFVWKKKGTVK